MKQVALGGTLAGIVLFVWSWVAHLPPLGTAGYRAVPAAQEAPLLSALQGALHERAIHLLPGMDVTHPMTPEEQQAWMARYEAGPAALIVFIPHPGERAFAGSLFASWFALEFITDMLAAWLAAAIALGLSTTLGYWRRVLLLSTLGLIVTIDSDASYWNWYGFPTANLLAQLVDHAGGWFLAGLVLARFCQVRRQPSDVSG
jgi:hypothetical protein